MKTIATKSLSDPKLPSFFGETVVWLVLTERTQNWMRRLATSLACFLIACAGSVAVFYALEICQAKLNTPLVLQEAVRKYGTTMSHRDLPAERLAILLKIEDPQFWRHRGVDLSTPGAGMTTITQGLVKLLYFPEGFQPGIAKIRQTLIAEYAFDALVSKEKQLDIYLNATFFGSDGDKPISGLPSAARAYFDKTPQELTDDEFIALIGMTISPETLKPGTPASDIRIARIKAHLAGTTIPASLLDFEYTGKTGGTAGEEALVSLLRLLTHSNPTIDGRTLSP